LIYPRCHFYSFYTKIDLSENFATEPNNINQIAKTVNQTKLLTVEQRDNLKTGIGQLIAEVDKDFYVKCQKLREFYGSH
uniref:plasmid mobilization relaxosome protein MobC n=1 Tax=Streptococcus suis TaxID=1307 RepID=UPI0004629435